MFGPDYVKLAEAYGIPGFRASVTDEVEDVVKKLFSIDGPVIAEFKVVKEENVYPMIPAGQSYNEIIDMNQENSTQVNDEEESDIEMITISKG
jgi:thiamine pyrophosphate-dependent acetolactate synthase large subunit-like protein